MFEKAREKRRHEILQSRLLAKESQTSLKSRTEIMTKLDEDFKQYEEEILMAEISDARPDSLRYWKSKVSKFPILAAAALDIVCSPMTEVSVERLFSHLSFILSPLRNRLKGEILDDILFLRLNNKFSLAFNTQKSSSASDSVWAGIIQYYRI